MNDDKLIELIAKEWVLHGGDRIGFEYLWFRIAEEISRQESLLK